jgi:hypothetical protein
VRVAAHLDERVAVDVSYSMDVGELVLQREGYAQAIVSREFLQALRTGSRRRVAVTYFEWSASLEKCGCAPWTRIKIIRF